MNNKTEQHAVAQAGTTTRDGRWMVGICVFLAIVLVGIAGRFWLVEIPNFKPVAALILFGGFYFRRAWPAILALMVIMVFSDLKLGVYSGALAACVYASLGLSCWLGIWIKRRSGAKAGSGETPTMSLRVMGRFVGASLAMSTTFFLLTNGAVWWMGQWYAGTWAGLVECYFAGLPFYRATLVGDLMFTGAIAGTYWGVQVLLACSASRSPSKQGLEAV